MNPLTKPASIRPAAVAGTFYPAGAGDLRSQVDDLLADAAGDAGTAGVAARVPKALIAPHAGYVYSGPIAAAAYARLAPAADRIRRVVLLGPVHRVAVRGLALPGAERFATPLGEIPIDRAGVEALRGLPQVTESARAHAPEHSLEVHLPFLQRALREFTLLPLAVGDATAEEVAAVLDRVWGGDETLIVVSSDLSHYLPYEVARRVDRDSVEAMLAFDAQLDPAQACGATPVNGLLRAAQRRGLRIELLDLRNSGDTAGDRSRVVGYAALALYERGTDPARADADTASATADARGPTLLAHARASIASALGIAHPAPADAMFLRAHGATFVTLKTEGELRGCVGVLEAFRPLGEDVRRNARAAAFEDTRFPPLVRAEYAQLSVEVSLLSAPVALPVAGEAELLRTLRPGVDGVTLEHRGRRSTFLPQVWAQLPEPRDFVQQLKRKAGLPAGFWSDELRIARYSVEKFAEAEEATWATH